jgi:glycine dehydrogenase subunit 1
MSLLGKSGLVELAQLNLAKSEYAKSVIGKLAGFSIAFSGATFNEFAVRVRGGNAAKVAGHLESKGIIAGLDLGRVDRDRADSLLVAVTERHTKADLDALVEALDGV